MRRHTGLKLLQAPANDICLFCATNLWIGMSRSTRIGRLPITFHGRSFRTGTARAQQPAENQAWEENKSSDFPFQPSPTPTGVQERSKAHAESQGISERGEGSSEPAKPPRQPQRTASSDGDKKAGRSKQNAAPREHRKRPETKFRIHRFWVNDTGAKGTEDLTKTVSEAQDKRRLPASRAANSARQTSNSPAAANPFSFPELEPTQTDEEPDWESNEGWSETDNGLQAKIERQKARMLEQTQLRAEKQRMQEERKRAKEAEDQTAEAERRRKHAALLEEQGSIPKQSGNKQPSQHKDELATQQGDFASRVTHQLPTLSENQRRDEIMRRMQASQHGNEGNNNSESSGPIKGSWRLSNEVQKTSYIQKSFSFTPTSSAAEEAAPRTEEATASSSGRDALSDFVEDVDVPSNTKPKSNRTRKMFSRDKSFASLESPSERSIWPDESAPSPRVSWKDEESERPISLRSRKFAEPDEEDRHERKPRRRRQDDDDLEDDRDRRKGGRRAMRTSRDEDEDRPRAGRRQERDLDEEALDDLSGLKRIRDKRQRDREAKSRRAKEEERRRAAIAAKRSTALTKIVLPQFITVSRLAQALGLKLDAFTRKMERLGFDNTAHDHVLSAENASMIALEFDFDPSIGTELEVANRDLLPRPAPEDQSDLPARPPIVTIMGHVDHGKTTILDFLRKSSVAASEHGGITQHIGAFSVSMSGGKLVTFLDTPGHAAFLSMRKRGATVTDIVVLVVAADDSVKPQTLEALKHAKEANVPIIVAVNKVDKPEADVQRVKQDLARHNIEIEDFGGDVQVVPVSGKTGQGMPDLEEAIVTLGEILDNRAENDGLVEGWVLEATTKAAGRVATVLVRRGTLRQGSIIVAGQTWARVRSLQNEAGVTVDSAGPGTPVEVDGWRDQPMAGDMVLESETEQRATDVVDYRVELAERQKLAKDVDAINEARRLEQEKRDREKAEAEARERDEVLADIPKETSTGSMEVPFIIKADVSGSAEAVEAYLQQLINPICSPKILRAGVGPVSEFDIEHASAAGGHIITFNLSTPPDSIAGLAAQSNVKVIEQNVIYRLLEQVKTILEDKLEPTKIQRVTGEAEVLKIFDIGIGGRKKLRIAGSRVRNGEMKRGTRVRVLRDGKKLYDGTIASLKNVKKDVTEMRKGTECGIGFEGWTEAREGDQVQTYEETLEKRSLPV